MNLASRLGIAWPLIQAPMAGVQDAELAIAVSEAGGLGSLPAAMLSPEALGEQIALIKRAGIEAFNVNFFCHTPPPPDPAADAAWRETLAPYYAEYGIDPSTVGAGAGRQPFDETSMAIIKATRPPVISFHFGLPDLAFVDEIRTLNLLIASSATTVAEAVWLDRNGADVIIAQGLEAGGHRGSFLDLSLTSQTRLDELLPQVCAATSKPVIAAGGIAGANDIRRCMADGAAGVQVGTSYLLCPEASTRAVHREALRQTRQGTAVTNVFSGRPARGIRNRAIEELGLISEKAPAFPGASDAFVPLREAAEAAGHGDFSPLWSGTDRSGCAEVSAAEMTARLSAGFD